jgi:riboflavin kinase / FMN adenylyltransferase
MIFHTKQIKGQGRGHTIGFPTINLSVSSDLILDEGIYACWVVIHHKPYRGALHYGSIPTFDELNKTMEVHLIGITDEDVPYTEDVDIEIDIVERIREIKKFAEPDDLSHQIARDIAKIKTILK